MLAFEARDDLANTSEETDSAFAKSASPEAGGGRYQVGAQRDEGAQAQDCPASGGASWVGIDDEARVPHDVGRFGGFGGWVWLG